MCKFATPSLLSRGKSTTPRRIWPNVSCNLPSHLPYVCGCHCKGSAEFYPYDTKLHRIKECGVWSKFVWPGLGVWANTGIQRLFLSDDDAIGVGVIIIIISYIYPHLDTSVLHRPGIYTFTGFYLSLLVHIAADRQETAVCGGHIASHFKH
ncbi:transposase-like protein [Pochonia chlamydosporia 170]|uniref:Transposase-like protein n=1 Tax=Pochonia chlamydosporia 170 TaxID=1380566 RepID=A0A179F6Z2_METCM|nr:transposase-like protein [Pochonia chlamydosporia 170]OAQ60923.2 transposase-like protein [Pochonia chlamydosporia 170]